MRTVIINSCTPCFDLIIQGGAMSMTPDLKSTLARLFGKCFGNTGNAVIGHSLQSVIRECGYTIQANIPTLTDLGACWDTFAEMIADIPVVFLCLQDILRPDALDIWSDEELELILKLSSVASGRLCVLSMGSNDILQPNTSTKSLLESSIPKRVSQVLGSLIDNALAIQVRTENLKAAIEDQYPDRKIRWLEVGCPSYFRKDIDTQKLLDNVALMTDWRNCPHRVLSGGLFGFEALELFSRTSYIPQSYSEIFLGDRLYQAGSDLPYPRFETSLACVLATGNTFTFIGPDAWDEYISSEHFLWYTGTRLHGGIMALLAGTPSVFCGGDQRTIDFTNQFSLPHSPGILLEEAPRVIGTWDWELSIRIQAESRCNFLSQISSLKLS